MTSSGSTDVATTVLGATGYSRSEPADATPAQACGAEERSATCYHCGQPLPAGARFETVIGGSPRAMCCAGCSAVAQAIVENGLVDYYARRDRFPDSPREAMPAIVSDLRVFDRDEIQRNFVSELAGHEREAALILEGINCPACIWLNEAHVASQPGVIAIRINYTTRRATVRWDARQTRLSDILAAIQAIGYRAYPYDPGAMETSRNRERRDALLRLAVAGLGMMQVMMYAFPAYIAGDAGISADAATLMRWASLMLTFPVVAYSSWPFFRGAARDLKRGRAGMDVPVAIGIGAAFAASVAATIAGHGEVYFDSVAMFVFFLLGGRYLELRARHRAAEYLEFLARAMPAVALRFRDFAQAQETEAIPAAALQPGDYVLVRPGESFPADGRIERGETDVDEALLTGESHPVARKAGDAVIGGAVNRGHAVAVRVERIGADTLLSGVVRLMERAMHERPRIQQLADRIAGRFVAVVLAIAAASALYWAGVDPGRALPVAVAVLVVTCPCALSLATPMAIAVATAAMARLGIVVTRGRAMETLARATHFVFDKTGTLTEGRLRVVEVRLLGDADHNRAMALAAALERQSEHPLAKAIVAAAMRDLPTALDVKNFPGKGVEGVIEGRRLRIGQKLFVAELCGTKGMAGVAPAHVTNVWLGDERGALAQFLLEDRVREDARELVSELRGAGRFVMLLSGDGAQAVRAAAAESGIPDFRARMLPEQKLSAVRELQNQGAVVAMIGDGVNDAPVLAQAQVSIAMGTGAAVAQGAADMVLVSPRLSDLGHGFKLSRKTLRIVRQNLSWAFAYNIVALPLAVTGWLTPWMAGIGMSASSLLVVLNALRARDAGKNALNVPFV
jgi:Cu2+-exporting ATPase